MLREVRSRNRSGMRTVAFILLILFAFVAPDTDLIFNALTGRPVFGDHGGPVHSLAVSPLLAGMFAIAANLVTGIGLTRLFLLGLAACWSHLGLDMVTSGRGIMLLWPFTSERIHAPFSLFLGVPHSRFGEVSILGHAAWIGNELLFAGVIAVAALVLQRRYPMTFAATTMTRPIHPSIAAPRDTDRASDMAHAVALVDAHVHIHPCFNLQKFLDSAAANFSRRTAGFGLPRLTIGCLMLTESAWHHAFRDCKDGLIERETNWTTTATAEPCSIVLRQNGTDRLILIAGRQVVTSEGLEVLALGVDQEFEDGQPLDAAVAGVLRSGAIAVLPWGFGKWIGRRKTIVRQCAQAHSQGFLGDNGGRLSVGPEPTLFSQARARRQWTLPGSDPLPFKSQQTRAGSCGIVICDGFNIEHPAESIRQYLERCDDQPAAFGERTSPLAFAWYQVMMQINKRMRRT